jgi:hypothetical protein
MYDQKNKKPIFRFIDVITTPGVIAYGRAN